MCGAAHRVLQALQRNEEEVPKRNDFADGLRLGRSGQDLFQHLGRRNAGRVQVPAVVLPVAVGDRPISTSSSMHLALFCAGVTPRGRRRGAVFPLLTAHRVQVGFCNDWTCGHTIERAARIPRRLYVLMSALGAHVSVPREMCGWEGGLNLPWAVAPSQTASRSCMNVVLWGGGGGPCTGALQYCTVATERRRSSLCRDPLVSVSHCDVMTRYCTLSKAVRWPQKSDSRYPPESPRETLAVRCHEFGAGGAAKDRLTMSVPGWYEQGCLLDERERKREREREREREQWSASID